MKKTFYYNVIPTKAEEDAAKSSNIEFQVRRTLVEIRDVYPPPPPDPNNPWQIRKQLTRGDIWTGMLILSHQETFETIFRNWTIEMTNYVLRGNKAHVVLWDVTEVHNPQRYQGESIFLESVSDSDFYVLGWLDVTRHRIIQAGDEIGLYWNSRSNGFFVKFFRSMEIN